MKDAIRKDKLERDYKRHGQTISVTAKARQAQQKAVDNNRYKIVAQKRALKLEGLDNVPDSSDQSLLIKKEYEDDQPVTEEAPLNDHVCDELEAKFHLYDVVTEEESQVGLNS